MAWCNVGTSLFDSGDLECSMSCLRMARHLSPLDWRIAFNYGLVLYNDHRWFNAFHAFHAATVLNPADSSTFMYVGLCLQKLQDFNNAKIFMEKSLSLCEYVHDGGGDGDDSECTARINYAILLLEMKDIENVKLQITKLEATNVTDASAVAALTQLKMSV